MLSHEPPDETGLGWHIRAFEHADIPALVALFDAADRADHLYKLSSAADISETFGSVPSNPQARVIVAVASPGQDTPDTTLAGVGRVSAHLRSATQERVYHFMIRVHPSARPGGLQHDIARQLAQIANELESDPSSDAVGTVRVLSYVFDSQSSSIEAWEKLGLRRVRTGWTMSRSLTAPIRVEPAPPGVILRTYRHPEDNLDALDAYNSALNGYFDFHPVSLSAWEREMSAPYSRPDLSWIALSEADPGKIVGVSGCQVNDDENRQTGCLEGWIEGIGVIPAYRNRRVGKALLLRCLQSLRDAGLDLALADVDSESLPALRLFQQSGFAARGALLQYECALSDINL